jgi:hypothetical protein
MKRNHYLDDVVAIAEAMKQRFGNKAALEAAKRAEMSSADEEAWKLWTDVARTIGGTDTATTTWLEDFFSVRETRSGI